MQDHPCFPIGSRESNPSPPKRKHPRCSGGGPGPGERLVPAAQRWWTPLENVRPAAGRKGPPPGHFSDLEATDSSTLARPSQPQSGVQGGLSKKTGTSLSRRALDVVKISGGGGGRFVSKQKRENSQS